MTCFASRTTANLTCARQPRRSPRRPCCVNPTHTLAFVIATSAISSTATAGSPYAWTGTGTSSPPTSFDCWKLSPTGASIPRWSRAQWSVAAGSSSRRADGAWAHAGAIVPQASYALWVRERQCAPGTGLFKDHAWLRWSLGVSADVAWRTAGSDSTDVRPALRLSRATYTSGFLSVGSDWAPSWELALTAGPTFDPSWSGGAISVGGRFTILTFELRAAARTESRGQEIMALFGITDVHGLWKIGANRE